MDVTKPQRFSRGYALSFAIIGVAMFGWLYGFSFEGRGLTESVFVSFAKIGAFGGLAMFAWSLILSGRYAMFDRLFHGQDKVYLAHRFFGTFSVVLLVLHPIALVLARIPEQGLFQAASVLVAFGEAALVLGMVSLYGLIWLIVWSITNKASYETFVRVHRLLGILFVAGASHAILSGSVLAANDFLFWYTLVLSAIATITFVHYSILGDLLHPYFAYRVTAIEKHAGGIIDIQLSPKYRHMPFRPGQYAYIYFDELAKHGYHPFTIASGYRQGELQFYIREAGDFTKLLRRVKKGSSVRVKGPYGGFTFDDRRFHKQLWIAGGIGVTPFLSKARSLQRARRWPVIELVYAVKTEADAFAKYEFDRIEHEVPRFNYTMLDETKFGLQSFSDIVDHFGSLDEYAIYVCGPPPMLAAYARQAEELGLSDQFYFEEFSFK